MSWRANAWKCGANVPTHGAHQFHDYRVLSDDMCHVCVPDDDMPRLNMLNDSSVVSLCFDTINSYCLRDALKKLIDNYKTSRFIAFDFWACTVSNEAAQLICVLCKKHPIAQLNLCSSGVSGIVNATICGAIAQNQFPHLKRLRINYDSITSTCALIANNTTLKELRIVAFGITYWIDVSDQQLLANVLASNTNLEFVEFNLGVNYDLCVQIFRNNAVLHGLVCTPQFGLIRSKPLTRSYLYLSMVDSLVPLMPLCDVVYVLLTLFDWILYCAQDTDTFALFAVVEQHLIREKVAMIRTLLQNTKE